MSELPDGNPTELDTHTRKQLRRFARHLGLWPYDLLLVADGSGNTYQRPAGWACVAYDPLLKKAVVHAGALTVGTNNFAELHPFVHALWFHDQEHQDEMPRGYRVAAVSDSEVTVRCGNREYARNANGCLWAGIEWFEQRDYAFQWHHVRRLSNVWNVFADDLAGRCRAAGGGLRATIGEAAGRLWSEVVRE